MKAKSAEAINAGRFGVYFGPFVLLGARAEREAALALETMGYGALWVGEGVGTRESFSHVSTLLSWTRQMVVATGIASIYARDPMAMANGARTLADAFPDRFVLGVGVSHALSVAARGHAYEAPIQKMRSYLAGMGEAAYKPAEPAHAAPVVLAALGPRMLRVARDHGCGAHSFLVPPEHTAVARRILGHDAFLAPEQAVLLETDASEARRVGRDHVAYYVKFDAYQRNLARMGFTQSDFEEGSDRLVDALVAWGGEDVLCDRVQAHLSAGANHVCIQALGPSPLETLGRLAAPLQELAHAK